MAQYIDKAALVAEIKRLYSKLSPNFYEYDYDAAKVELLEKLENFLNTLEVKEVDLEKIISFQWSKFCLNGKDKDSFVKVVKHFFELGMLSTITEEDCKLIWNIGDGLPCMKEEDFFKELLRRFKAQKGEKT